ncbi:hypothetical protein PENNAL_c0154G00570, partial [Penicillium nalgiovense]
PPEPENRLTTDQLMDRKVAKKYTKEEQSAESTKHTEGVPGHSHAETADSGEDAGTGPSHFS